MHQPPKGSDESKLLEILRNPIDWVPLNDKEAGAKWLNKYKKS